MKTGDIDLLKMALPTLLQEHKFWNSGFHKVIIRDAHGAKHSLSRYYARWDTPRPESATIDMETAAGLTESKKKKGLLYREIATAAESGWDFSSRWLRDRKNLTTLHTNSIISVDLNVFFLLQMELNIEFFAKTLGESSIAETFIQASNARHIAIDMILLNNEMRQWLNSWLDPLKCEHIQINDQQSEEIHVWDASNQNKNIFFLPIFSHYE
jgi:alpha,alpha-trehalase